MYVWCVYCFLSCTKPFQVLSCGTNCFDSFHITLGFHVALFSRFYSTFKVMTAFFSPPSSPDLISHLLDSVVDPLTEEVRQLKYEQIVVPESYRGPRISFPLSVTDTNALLSAFKEEQVQHYKTFTKRLQKMSRKENETKVLIMFFFSDSPWKICAAVATWNEEVLKTDAECHIPVDVLCKRNYYLWWDDMFCKTLEWPFEQPM